MSYFNGKQIHNVTSRGDSIFVRFSENPNGAGFTENWIMGQQYIGFAQAQVAPTDYRAYKWMRIVPQKGTDYWTEEDKADIKKYVDDAILNGVW